MPRRTWIRRAVVAGMAIAMLAWPPSRGTALSRADPPPPKVALAGPVATERHRIPPRNRSGRLEGDRDGGAGGWWLGTAGVALALAVCGGVSLASRRFSPREGGGLLRVVGRASLSPKQAVYLLQVGGRVLIVGAGGQGPPSLLGEVTDPATLDAFATRRRPPTVAVPGVPSARGERFDHIVGGDE